jgi:ribosomal protein L29
MAKKQKLNEKNVAELTSMLAKEREELRHLRFASAGSRPKDSAAPKKTRRQVARILTELHAQKTLGAALSTPVETPTA